MVYKRGYKKSYRKNPTKKRYYRKRGNSWFGIAKKALSTAKYVAGLVNSEYKLEDNSAANQNTTWSGTISGNLCAPGQGTSANQREGDSIKMKNLTLRAEFARNGVDELVRLIVFIDKENNMSIGSDVLKTTASSLGVFSPKNDNNRYDTKILYDKEFKITSNYPIVKIDKVIKIDMHQHFSEGTTTGVNNVIKMLWIGQEQTTGTNFSYYTRMTYIDN